MKKRFCIIEIARSTHLPHDIFELDGIATIESAYYVLQWHLADKADTAIMEYHVREISNYPHWDAYEEANAAA